MPFNKLIAKLHFDLHDELTIRSPLVAEVLGIEPIHRIGEAAVARTTPRVPCCGEAYERTTLTSPVAAP